MKKSNSTSTIRIPRAENAFIEEYVRFYLTSKGTDFAVLITAPWGSGKTHFVKSLMVSIQNEHPSLPKGIYVSLNGMSSISEIDQALFSAMHPILGSKYTRLACHVLSGMLQTGVNITIPLGDDKTKSVEFGLPNNLLDQVNAETKKHEGWYLVFDDLERASIPPGALWGYLGDLSVSGQKIILVGNEAELRTSFSLSNTQSEIIPTDENKSCSPENTTYCRVKEKVVGKTFSLRTEIHDIYGSLAQRNEYKTAYDTIIGNRDRIISILEDYQERANEEIHYNYRALKHCFRDFDYWMKQIDSKLRANSSFCNDFFCEFIPLDYAVQVGRLSIDNRQKVGTSALASACEVLGRSKPVLGVEDVDEGLFILPWKLLAGLLSNNPPRVDTLNLAIQRTQYFLKRTTPAWVRLWHTSSLSDEDFKKQWERLQDDVTALKYSDPEEIIHVFCVINGLRKMELAPARDTMKEFVEYLEKVKDQIDIDHLDPRKFDLSGLATGLTYYNEDGEQQTISKFKNRMKAVLVERKDIKRTIKVQNLVSILDKETAQFLDFFAADEGFEPSPLLQNIDLDQFFEKFISLSPEKQNSVFHVFETRYRTDRKERMRQLRPEFDFVTKFVEKINQWYIDHKEDKGSLKVHYMKLLVPRAVHLLTVLNPKDVPENPST